MTRDQRIGLLWILMGIWWSMPKRFDWKWPDDAFSILGSIFLVIIGAFCLVLENKNKEV